MNIVILTVDNISSTFFGTTWLTDELLSSIKAKHRAKRLAEHTKDPSDISNYITVSRIN